MKICELLKNSTILKTSNASGRHTLYFIPLDYILVCNVLTNNTNGFLFSNNIVVGLNFN